MTTEELEELEEIEKLDAEGRRVYNPLDKTFEYGAKRVTDLDKNKKVTLPNPCDPFTESSIELIKSNVMKTFNSYMKRECNEKGEQVTNLKRNEQKGLRKLKKRILNHEILVLKTNKSGKLTVINREKYKKKGMENCKRDREIGRIKHKRIERRINEQSRFWCKMLNYGKNHGHQDRIEKSELCSSENAAPKYYLFKDHKDEGGYRPVVGGCTSDTLGLSNTLS